MSILFDENGITIKKFFSKRVIQYNELRSIVLSDSEYTFTTKAGEIITLKQRLLMGDNSFYEGIKKYNIIFKDEDQLKQGGNVYPSNEINEKIAQMQTVIEEYAGKQIREKYGNEYGIDCNTMEEGELLTVNLRLTKSGELVRMPEVVNKYLEDIDVYTFDNLVVAFLVEWDGNGRYGVTNELVMQEACEKYVDSALELLFENYVIK